MPTLRKKFKTLVEQTPHFKYMDLAQAEFGLGAAQYIPAHLASQEGEKVDAEVTKVNRELVRHLQDPSVLTRELLGCC